MAEEEKYNPWMKRVVLCIGTRELDKAYMDEIIARLNGTATKKQKIETPKLPKS